MFKHTQNRGPDGDWRGYDYCDIIPPMTLGALAKKYDLALVILFGSRATGQIHRESDIDIAYLGRGDLSLSEEAKLAVDLAPLLGGAIDLISLRRASPLLRYHVFSQGKLLYEAERGLFNDYLSRTNRVYKETLPLFRAKQALL